jgi:cation transport regulator ChaB
VGEEPRGDRRDPDRRRQAGAVMVSWAAVPPN